jgi:hypothetical protein
MTTNDRIRSHLRKLVSSVLNMRQCATDRESGCALLCSDGHLNTVYKRAMEADALLRELERAPS